MNLLVTKCVVAACVGFSLDAVGLAQQLTVELPPVPIGTLNASAMAADLKSQHIITLSPNALAGTQSTFSLTYGTAGTTWTNLNTTLPAGAQVVGGNPILAFDLSTPAGVVLSLVNGVWVPVPLVSTLRPPVVSNYGLARLPSGSVLLFGGATAASPVSAVTWLFKGDHWVDLTGQVGVPPAPRNGHAMCGTSTGAILTGGSNPATFFADTWTYSETTGLWTLLGATLPKPVTLANLTYDSRLDTAILGGGFDPSIPGFVADVQMLNLAAPTPGWVSLASGPGTRALALAYDPVHDETIAADVNTLATTFFVVHDLTPTAAIGAGCPCTSNPGNSFLAVLPSRVTGDVHIPDTLVFTMFRAPMTASTPTFLLFGSGDPFPATQIPGFGIGCNFLVDPATIFQTLAMTPGTGSLPSLVFQVPADLTLVGVSARVQALQFNSVSNCASNARRIVLRR